MRKFVFWLFLISLAVILVGCGGGNNNDPKDSVTIRDFAFVPQNLTVTQGTTVTWSNAGSTTHTVVSGTLDAFLFKDLILVDLQDIGFTNPNLVDGVLRVHLGDTIRFTNQSTIPRQVEVKRTVDLQQIFITPVLLNKQFSDYQTTLGGPGDFTVKDSVNQAHTFELLVEGRANPDGLFDSGPINPGQSFEHNFNTVGTFPYFCSVHNVEEGTITVQAP